MRPVCIVVPCFNEAARIDVPAFDAYLAGHPEVGLCFVDDGSTDATHELLAAWQTRRGDDGLTVLHSDTNHGKAEAVRRGVRHAMASPAVAILGYLDADLATPLEEMDGLRRVLAEREGVVLALGARVPLAGRRIKRGALRHLFGRVFAILVGAMVRMRVYDTQCGAKVFRREVVPVLFDRPFVSQWFFDVELLLRLKAERGRVQAIAAVAEVPLRQWIARGGSKLKARDFVLAPVELLRIAFAYRQVVIAG